MFFVQITLSSKKNSQSYDPVYEDTEIVVSVHNVNDPPSPRHAPLPPAIIHPVRGDSEYQEIDPPPKPSLTNHSVVEDTDDEASQEPVYTVVKKPSSRVATAANDEVDPVVSSHTSGQPTDVIGYQIERVNESAEQSVEANTPPRTEEMEILVENTDSGSFDDAVNEIDDQNVYVISALIYCTYQIVFIMILVITIKWFLVSIIGKVSVSSFS